MEELTLSPPWRKEDLIIHSKFCNSTTKYNNELLHIWDKLSNEIIVTIFSWLPKSVLCKTSLVCHRFYFLSHAETLWDCMDLSGRKISLTSLMHLMNLGVKVMKLSRTDILQTSNGFKESTLDIKRNAKMTHLDLSFAHFSDVTLFKMLSGQTNITHLSLEDCCLNQDICKLISQNNNLQILNLCRCEGLDEIGSKYIFTCCPGLLELNLGWAWIESDCVHKICNILPQGLIRLNFSGSRESLTDDDLIAILKRCESLEELDVSDCSKIGVASVEGVCNYARNLKALSMSRCYEVEPNVLLQLKALKGLKHLNIFNLLNSTGLVNLKDAFNKAGVFIEINQNLFSTIARPTTGISRTSIWKQRTRELTFL